MPTTSTLHSSTATVPASENQVLGQLQLTLKLAFGLVPIVAGLDKFTNILAHWENYLNPLALRIVPVSDVTFMRAVGVIEIIAGVIVLVRPRVGAFIVMAWLLAIAAQLLVGWMYPDVAVRDIVMALGALTLARLTPIVQARRSNSAI
ncbi:MAG TPA: tRNA (5-methylaminomethyl-2-thiouridylate)-methyltransferase [Opitutaceae bacterium]|nr:tRNA (5-methylaminomethyl-2-thiouridylate)-methyltransferase [Opitutaceae bacterium]